MLLKRRFQRRQNFDLLRQRHLHRLCFFWEEHEGAVYVLAYHIQRGVASSPRCVDVVKRARCWATSSWVSARRRSLISSYPRIASGALAMTTARAWLLSSRCASTCVTVWRYQGI